MNAPAGRVKRGLKAYIKYLICLACLLAAFIAGVAAMTVTAIGVCREAIR